MNRHSPRLRAPRLRRAPPAPFERVVATLATCAVAAPGCTPITPWLSVAGRHVEGELKAQDLLIAAKRGELRRGDILRAVRETSGQALVGLCARLQQYIEFQEQHGPERGLRCIQSTSKD